jgi:transcriptional regulator with XRE-family HTH domain
MARGRRNPVGAVIGSNVRRAREHLGATLDDVGRALRDRGWRVSNLQLGDLEQGRRSVKVEELFALADALNVPAASLLQVPPDLHDRAGIGGESHFVERLTAAPFAQPMESWSALEASRRAAQFSETGRHSIADESMREAERYAAQVLDLSADDVVRQSYALWGRTLSDERDHRAAARIEPGTGKASRAMIRAHVTRRLLEELRDIIEPKEQG